MRILIALCLSAFIQVSVSQGALVTFMANLAGPSSPATGSALLTLDTDANTYSVSMMVTNLDPSTLVNVAGSPVHIHLGGPTDSGPILNNLGLFATRQDFGTFGFSYAGNGIAVDGPTEAALLANNTYINVHTTSFPTGEIRGQLMSVTAVPEPTSLGLLAVGACGVGLHQIRRRRR